MNIDKSIERTEYILKFDEIQEKLIAEINADESGKTLIQFLNFISENKISDYILPRVKTTIHWDNFINSFLPEHWNYLTSDSIKYLRKYIFE